MNGFARSGRLSSGPRLEQSIGMHFGTFQLTTEAIDQPRKDLTRELCQVSILETEFVTLDEGETRIYRADLP